MTRCNYCSMQDPKKRARKEKARVYVRASRGMGGYDIYLVPLGTAVPDSIQGASDKLPNGDEFHQKYFVAWFMSIPKGCVC